MTRNIKIKDLSESKKMFLPILSKLFPSDEVDPTLCSFYKGAFTKDFEELYTHGENINIDRLTYIKLNIMLHNGELSVEQLSWLSKQPFIGNLSTKSLLALAKIMLKNNANTAFSLVKTVAGKIDNIISLYAALNILEAIGLKENKEAKLIKTKIAIAGNCTLKPLTDYLKIGMLLYDIDIDVWEVPFDQWANQMLDNNSEFYQYNPSFLVLYLSSLGLTLSGTEERFEAIEVLEKCIDKLAKNSSMRIIMILPEPLEEQYYTSSRYYQWRDRFTMEIKKRFKTKMVFVDPISAIAEIGSNKWFAYFCN